MENLKRPEIFLSVTALTGLLGSTIYFWRQLSNQSADIDDLRRRLGGMALQMNEINKVIPGIQPALETYNTSIERQEKRITRTARDLETVRRQNVYLQAKVDALVHLLEADGKKIDVKMLPSSPPKEDKKSHSGKKPIDSDSDTQSDVSDKSDESSQTDSTEESNRHNKSSKSNKLRKSNKSSKPSKSNKRDRRRKSDRSSTVESDDSSSGDDVNDTIQRIHENTRH